jgi:hypothetical protein
MNIVHRALSDVALDSSVEIAGMWQLLAHISAVFRRLMRSCGLLKSVSACKY